MNGFGGYSLSVADCKKRSVGLLVITHVNSIGLVAVLQRRGEFNHETMAPETYSGACQLTAHGKVEVGEFFVDALLREVREELGLKFFDIVLRSYKDRLLLNHEYKDGI